MSSGRKNLIVEKCHCEKCGKNLMTRAGIRFELQDPDEKIENMIVYLSGTVGDYSISKKGKTKIPKGTKLIILCPECQQSLHIEDGICKLVNVKFRNDPYKNYTIKFLSPMGQHGTVVEKEDVEICHDGEDYSQFNFGEKHAMNKTDQDLIRTTGNG